MTDSNHSINPRELSSRLNQLAQNDTTHNPISHVPNTMSGTRRLQRTTSLDSLPPFTKSPTTSTTSSTSTRFSGLHAYPSAALHRKDVEISPGAFSMPRVPKRSRRDADARGKKKDSFEAHAYGRHGNQWLFNGFSVTDAVRKGCGRVFGREN